LEAKRAEQAAPSCEIVTSDRGRSIINEVLNKIKDKKICSDCDDYSTIELLVKNMPQGSIIIDSEPFSAARMIKEMQEIEMIAKASEIIDKLYEICTKEVRPGQSESSLQATLVYEALKSGASLISYKWSINPFIIASGPNSSYPHAEVTDRVFNQNDIIVIDLTLRYSGYVGDATRTFFLGRPNPRVKEIYEIVKLAQETGLDSLKSAQITGSIDEATRSVIEKAGYGSDFIHSTGHGVGLEVHERPWIRIGNAEKIQGGMVVTVEPGIYIKNKYGVRIEDTVVVNNNSSTNYERAESLNSFTKELVEIS
jgi:Xaa-Pro aminopeptidase/Xaa-Pro dipeptidase